MENHGHVVQCTVCKTAPTAPRLFPCGHVVCAKCLAQIISNRYEADGNLKPSSQTRCPTCQQSFKTSAENLERLPVGTPMSRSSSQLAKDGGGAVEENGISYTDSSKNMISGDELDKKRPFVVEHAPETVEVNDVDEERACSVDSENHAQDEDSQKKDELPVIEAVTKSSKLFAATLATDVEGGDKRGNEMRDLIDVRLPLQNLLASEVSDRPFDDDFDAHTSEGGSSYEDDVRSNSSTEVNNLCTICKLSQRYVSASSYCVSCGCLVCSSCTRVHQEHAPDRRHVIVQLTSDNLRTVLCRTHDQLVRFFCTTCCVPVCKACLTEQHTQHRMTDFTTSAGPDRAIRSVGWHVHGLAKDLLAQKRALAKAYEVTELNRRETNTAIVKTIDGHIRYLQERRQELVDSSDRYHGLVKEQMAIVERQVDRAMALIQDIQLRIDTSMYPLPPHDRVVPAAFPISVIQKRFSGVLLPAKDHRDFGIVDCKYASGSTPDAGRLNTGIAVSSADLREINQARQNRVLKVKVLWNKAVQVRDVHFIPGSKDLLFTDVGKGHTMHKLNCDGKLAPLLVGLSGFAGRQCAFGINRYTGYKVIGYKPESRGNDIVLTVFDSDAASADVSLIGATFPPGYDTLVGLTSTLDGLIVAVLSDDAGGPTKTSLCCFSQDGRLLWQRNTSPSGRAGDLAAPGFVTTDRLDRLIVSDRAGSRVNVYTCDGSHLLSFPSLDEGTLRPQPTGVCLDSRGRILVSFHDLKVVSLFTANGHFMRHVVQTIGPPLGISLCDEDKFLIVALEDHGLWLYNLGDFD